MVQKTPLNGRVIAVTRPAEQAPEAGKIIKSMGGIPYYIPAIEIKGLSNLESIKKFTNELCSGQVNYTIFMSTNGAKYLFRIAEELKLTHQIREGLDKTIIIAVGPKTAEAIKELKIHVDMVPQKYSSGGLLEAFHGTNLHGKKIRIPRTSNATPTLTNALKQLGADVQEIYVYESSLPIDESLKTKFYADLTAGRINAILFGSGLSAKNIFRMLSEKASMEQLKELFKKKVTTVAIGPTTAEALKAINIRVDVTPQDYLFEEALRALAEFWSRTQS